MAWALAELGCCCRCKCCHQSRQTVRLAKLWPHRFACYRSRLLVLQLRKARDFQRLADQENDRQAGNTGGYRGPDGSGQWVSMGEMGADDDLDMVLRGLGGGQASDSIPVVV